MNWQAIGAIGEVFAAIAVVATVLYLARDIRQNSRSLSEPLVPSCIVNYRRIALQDASASLRVTLDTEIGFYAPPPDLWQRTEALIEPGLRPLVDGVRVDAQVGGDVVG